jgi:hypothetical protein
MLRYPSGCLTQYETNVGYYPNRLSRAATLRSGPGTAFRVLQRLDPGQRVGRQSARNPDRSATPPRRDSRDGYAWVYVLEDGRSGWVSIDVLEADPGGWADGPASGDFEIGDAPGVRHVPRRRRRPRLTLGRGASGRRVVRTQEVYLRYAARSAPFSYLEAGDVVDLRWSGRKYACVEVVSSSTTPEGARGWVSHGALRKP